MTYGLNSGFLTTGVGRKDPPQLHINFLFSTLTYCGESSRIDLDSFEWLKKKYICIYRINEVGAITWNMRIQEVLKCLHLTYSTWYIIRKWPLLFSKSSWLFVLYHPRVFLDGSLTALRYFQGVVGSSRKRKLRHFLSTHSLDWFKVKSKG